VVVWDGPAHLFARLCVEENPTKLNDFCRVFGYVDAVLVAGRGYVDDDVSVEVGGLGARSRLGRHSYLCLWQVHGQYGYGSRTPDMTRRGGRGSIRQLRFWGEEGVDDAA
jgi:hypothetical protein